MRRSQVIVCLLSLLVFHGHLKAQESFSIKNYNKRMHRINMTGMKVLGSWSAANILVSSGFWIANQGSQEEKHFHQMNVAWNVINLRIAAFGYFEARKKLEGPYSLAQTIDSQKSYEKILLFNSGLDVAYILAGVLMLEAGTNNDKNRDLLRGFGRSIILQGSFLLLFDAALYSIHNKHGRELNRYLQGLTIDANTIGYSLRF